jgi:MOSC domain-containing protein YiiM
MRDTDFGLAFRRAERPGFYFRVLNSGDLTVGDAVTYVANHSNDVSMLELFRFNYALQHEVDELKRFLQAPIAIRFREKIERKLLPNG